MVDEFNEAVLAAAKLREALKNCARFDDRAEALEKDWELRLRRLQSDLSNIRFDIVEASEREGG